MSRFLGLTLLILTTLAPQFAHAAKRLIPETYSATDSSAGIAPVGKQQPLMADNESDSDELSTPEESPSSRPAAVEAAPLVATPAVQPQTRAQGAQAAQASPTYDTVPIEQTDAFVKRLGLVSEILKKYGRAYDYRMHTVKELETLLNELGRTEVKSIRVAPSTPPVPVIVPRQE
jgi:hypothetical protein